MKKEQVTPFQQRVYNATKRIPRGKVTTYGALAKTIRCGSARAVGQALAKNPFAPKVPCHRVIASDRTLGGFMGKTRGPRLAQKRLLLQREGVRFEGSRVAKSSCIVL
jgi:methylated-DNA-[protein]-cysteine S-methyltransferase